MNNNNILHSLTEFDKLSSIGGELEISYNNTLVSLSGLDSIGFVGGHVSIIGNNNLESLSGLENLISVLGSLYIGSNDRLSDITGLKQLTLVDDLLGVWANPLLTSLEGLDNIDAGSISGVYVYENFALSTCHVQSICEYLASPNGAVEIYDNAYGCNGQEQIEELCMVGIGNQDNKESSSLKIYPNPANSSVNITVVSETPSNLFVYSMGGQIARTFNIESGDRTFDWDLNDEQGNKLPAGYYILKLETAKEVLVEKLIIY